MDNLLDNGMVFAGYVVERLLGRGGTGSVYLVHHPRLPRLIALKVLHRDTFLDKEARARFEREADVVAQLDHRNIVTVFDRGIEHGQPWITMQYIDGSDAASVDVNTMAPLRAARIVVEIAKALDFAHRRGVLHRDVKPANILLSRSADDSERVYLNDFGIARLRDDSQHLTETGSFTATLAYASPEQLTGAPIDHRSDQYSLACSLFWLLTGRAPYPGNPAAVVRGHLQSLPPAVSSLRPGFPPELDGYLAKAMAKRPDDRFDSCTEFAESVFAVLQQYSAASPRQRAPVSRPADAPTGSGMVADSPPQSARSRYLIWALAMTTVVALTVTAAVVGARRLPTVQGHPVAAAPVTYAPPPQADDNLWDPCSLSDDALRSAGLDPATKKTEADIGTRKDNPTVSQCLWLAPAEWYNLWITTTDESLAKFRQDMEGIHESNFIPVSVAGRAAFRFVGPLVTGGDCDVVLEIPQTTGPKPSVVRFEASTRPVIGKLGDPCTEVMRHADILAAFLPR